MLKSASTFALFILLSTSAFSAGPGTETPVPATEIMQPALKQAEATRKNIFLIFHASWCVWCRRLDSVLTNQEVKGLIDRNYVVVHLDVLERGDKKASLENPGAEEILKKLGGEQAGLPFYAFLDAKGKEIADSDVMPGDTKNIGFPGSKEEIAAFGRLLERTAGTMTPAERQTILSHFAK